MSDGATASPPQPNPPTTTAASLLHFIAFHVHPNPLLLPLPLLAGFLLPTTRTIQPRHEHPRISVETAQTKTRCCFAAACYFPLPQPLPSRPPLAHRPGPCWCSETRGTERNRPFSSRPFPCSFAHCSINIDRLIWSAAAVALLVFVATMYIRIQSRGG